LNNPSNRTLRVKRIVNDFWNMALALISSAGLLVGVVAANPPEEVDEEEKPGRAEQGVVFAVQEQGPEVFDQWVFPRGSEQNARHDLQTQLSLRINDLERVCELTPAQMEKLNLAGQTDIKRLFDTIAVARRKFEVQRKDARNVNVMFQELQPLRRLFTGMSFQEHSVFDKVARTLLTADQAPRYQTQQRERRQFRLQAQREMLLQLIDREVPLRAKQRKELLALLEQLPSIPSGQYEMYALWYSASKLPAEAYEKILDEGQLKTLRARFAPMQNMEQWLKQSGALGEDAAEK
jgi:hypothetical protein